MISILDLCSREWERDAAGGDYDWEVVCTGWSPESAQRLGELPTLATHGEPARRVPEMPLELVDADLDRFIERMTGGGE